MKIFFKKRIYDLDELEQLSIDAPFFKSGVNFIKDWISNNQEYIFKTSGSTGKSQNIRISRSQIAASVQMTRNALQLKGNEQVLICLSPEFVATKMMLARCLILDLDIVLVEPTGNPIVQLQPQSKIDFASFVPLQIRNIIDDGYSEQLANIKNVLIGGGPISNGLEQELCHFRNKIYHTYGMTETVSHIALRKLSQGSNSKYFNCLEGVSIKLDSDECLNIKGAVTNDLEIQTKDIVEIKNKKEFRWMGRRDNLINTGGIKIIPELIENHLIPLFNKRNYPENYFLFGSKDEVLGQKLIMVIEGKSSDIELER